MSDVCLAYVPYGPLERPSLAMGLLKAGLQAANIDCQVLYLTFDFAERIGLVSYQRLAFVREEMIGEWTFAAAAFPEFDGDSQAYLERALVSLGHEDFREALVKARQEAVPFIEEAARRILAGKPKVVACSSTFNQNCAALALTRKLKELAPEVITVVGGANCDGEMGLALARNFAWVDLVISGEADELFPRLCRTLLDGGLALVLADVPDGVIPSPRLRPLTPAGVPRAKVANLDLTAMPDFDEYFEGWNNFSQRSAIHPGLIIETSRGCWWGAVHHCTFCGLNGGSMTFRSKSAERAVQEFNQLSSRYGLKGFLVADNIIDTRYYRDVLPQLESQDYQLFYEIKANVKYEQMVAMQKAGVSWIQPGIESLHDDALKLMDKGTTTWQNLQLLKWARELGLHVSWNILCGFPNESDDWYAEMAEWFPLVYHLQCPKELRPIRFDRFSPYHGEPERYDLQLRPVWPMAHIYPVPPEELVDLSYIFEEVGRAPLASNPFRGKVGRELENTYGGPGKDRLAARIQEWIYYFLWNDRPVLAMTEEEDSTDIFDTRPCAPQRRVTLTGLAHRVHHACDSSQTLSSLKSSLQVGEDELQAVLHELQEARLVLATGNRYLSLAVRGEQPALPRFMQDGFPGGWIESGHV